MISKNRLILSVVICIFIMTTLLSIVGTGSVQATAIQPRQEMQTYSCLHPTSYEMRIHCANLEANILAVTVRIEMHAQYDLQGHTYTKVHPSHATIMAGRYLVTHNHFKFSLTETAASGEEGYLAISLRRSDGTLILDQAPLNVFRIVHMDPQTLVLEFLDAQGNGLFSTLGLPSADFTDWHAVHLQPGIELAQIDWNGERAFVDWVQIDLLQLEDTVPQLQVNNFARFGCSGGGVFWNGQHIGNNWARNSEEDPVTEGVTRRYSIVALNSSSVLTLAH
jgi:hypothetical protein